MFLIKIQLTIWIFKNNTINRLWLNLEIRIFTDFIFGKKNKSSKNNLCL